MAEIVRVFNGADVRIILRGAEPWFIASDVCRILEIGNTSDALRRLDDDERTLVSIEGGPSAGTNLVSEAGLFALVLGSRKPEARAFKRWVTHDVLPSIRRTGAYGQPDPIALLGDPNVLRKLLGSYAERVQAIEATVAEQAPKAAIVDRIVDTGDTLGFREAAKLVREATGAVEGVFRGLMHRRGWIQRLGGQLAPTSIGMDRGYVTTRDREFVGSDGARHVRPELRVTQKGLTRAIELLLASEAA